MRTNPAWIARSGTGPVVSRRGFLAASAGMAALAALPGRALAGLGRRDDLPATFFDLELAGGDLAHPVAGTTRRVRVLLGSPGTSSNSMVLVDEGGSLLVDVSTPGFGQRMAEDAALVGGPVGHQPQDEREPRDAIVVNTHHHFDHTGGNFALGLAGPRPRVVMHATCDARVRNDLERYRGAASSAMRSAQAVEDPARRDQAIASARALIDRAPLLAADDFSATETFDAERHDINVGATLVQLHHFGPGHTDNDTVVLVPDDNVLHAGDLLFAGLHPYFADDSGATAPGWIESVARTIDLCDRDTVVVPGHGPVCGVDELRRQKEYLEQLWEAVSVEVRRGTPRGQVVEKTWPFMDGLGFEQIRPRAIGAVYDEVRAAG